MSPPEGSICASGVARVHELVFAGNTARGGRWWRRQVAGARIPPVRFSLSSCLVGEEAVSPDNATKKEVGMELKAR